MRAIGGAEGFLKQAKVLYGLLPAESSLAIVATRARAGCGMLPSAPGGWGCLPPGITVITAAHPPEPTSGTS